MNLKKILAFGAGLILALCLFTGCGEKEPYETFERESRKPKPSTEAPTPDVPEPSTEDPGESTPAPQPTEPVQPTEPAGPTEGPAPTETPVSTDPPGPSLESAAWGSGMEYKRYDEQGRLTERTRVSESGRLRFRQAREYFPDSQTLFSETKEEYSEDGALTYRRTDIYYESGNRRSDDTTNEDGSRQYFEYTDSGLCTLDDEYYPDGRQRHHLTREFDAENRQTAEQFANWNEDGSLSTRGEYTYWPNGNTKTARLVPTWNTDAEFFDEYDELGRKIYSEWNYASTGIHGHSEEEYYGDSNALLRSSTSDWDGDQLTVTEREYDKDGHEIRRQITNPDGSVWLCLYNEDGRPLHEENTSPDGVLLSLYEAEYYPGSSQVSHMTDKTWNEEDKGYDFSENWYSADGIQLREEKTFADGSGSSSEYNGNGDLLLSESRYPGGQKESRTENDYSAETGTHLRFSETLWSEDGTETYFAERTYYEETGLTHTSYNRSENHGYYSEFDTSGNRTVYREDKNGTIVYDSADTFDENGKCTGGTYSVWSDDGSFVRSGEYTNHPNGEVRTNYTKYADGSASYYEYAENGATLIEKTINPAGIVDRLYTVRENGSCSLYTYYEDGALATHTEWNADDLRIYYLYRLPNGNLYTYETAAPNGDRESRTFDSDGLVKYQDLYVGDMYYDRRFTEGRMFLERREKKASDGGYTYLGSTEYSYFEEGGVKKIRIYENNELGVQISSKVVNDDGKIGYIDPPQEWWP